MFYQQQPKTPAYFRIQTAGDWSIQMHIHSFFEFLSCQEGEIPAVIAGEDYHLKAGDAVLIFPYQPHSYPTKGTGKGVLCTFEPALIGGFAEQYADYLPRKNSFRFSGATDDLFGCVNVFAIKSFLYSMCAVASESLEFVHTPAGSWALLERIFVLTEQHYTDAGFDLKTLSEMLTYDYGYISKYFLRKTGMKYNYYLNQRRVQLAGKMLKNGEADSIGDIAYACGYQSVRSFNRNFKSIYGVTPQAF